MKIRLFTIVFLSITLVGLSQNIDSSFQIQLINNLLDSAGTLIEKENPKEALQIIQKVEPLILPLLGPNSMEYARLSQTYGQYYENEGDFAKAEQRFKAAIEIYKGLKENNGLPMAKALNSLAGIYIDLGRADESEELYLIALGIREKLLGKNHPDYASVLNNIGGIAHFKGDYTKAIKLIEQAKNIYRSNAGTESVKYAMCLHNLGNIYYDTGEYGQAESFYSEALLIREKLFGRLNPTCAASLNCLGNLYSSMGLPEKALNIYLEALSIYEKTIGENHINTAGPLNNIANIYCELNQFKQAEAYYIRSQNIYLKTTGPENPDYAMNLDNMANMYARMKNKIKAESLYKEGLKIRENIFGTAHPEYAMSLNNLGSYYSNNNQLKEAENFLSQAKNVWEKIFGKEHPDYLLGLNNLNRIYWLTNRLDKLHNNMVESINLEQKLVLRASKHLSENELSSYIKTFASNLDGLYSLQHITGKLCGMSYDNALFYKGYLLNAVSNFNKLAKEDTAHIEKFNQLKLYHTKIARELSLPKNERSNETIRTMESKANILEKELTGKIKGLSDSRKNPTFLDIRNKLKQGEAAIEFIHFNYTHPHQTDSIIYAALIIKPELVEPIYVKLFEEKELNALLMNNADRRSEYVNSLYSIHVRGANLRNAVGKSLADLLWSPLSPNLMDIKTIYYSTTGILHRLNLDAIPINESETLADKFELVALNSTRQIALPNTIEINNNKSIIFGGINFDKSLTMNSQNDQLTNRSNEEILTPTNPSINKINNWEFLPGTEKEGMAIERIMKTNGYDCIFMSGTASTEEKFKILGKFGNQSPRNIHLATHGYFFKDDRTISANGKKPQDNAAIEGNLTDSIQQVGTKATSIKELIEAETEEPVFKTSDHPMLRSGLIMAGGNNAWKGEPTPVGEEDGVLTAYEISQMNLSNTELVVLSACETGLGDIEGNEGVYGLQRAFKIAGVKYLIMSLWQVPDKQTSILMITFYKKWLDEKMTIPVAFHAAQKELRDLGLDPYQWAGFVLVE